MPEGSIYAQDFVNPFLVNQPDVTAPVGPPRQISAARHSAQGHGGYYHHYIVPPPAQRPRNNHKQYIVPQGHGIHHQQYVVPQNPVNIQRAPMQSYRPHITQQAVRNPPLSSPGPSIAPFQTTPRPPVTIAPSRKTVQSAFTPQPDIAAFTPFGGNHSCDFMLSPETVSKINNKQWDAVPELRIGVDDPLGTRSAMPSQRAGGKQPAISFRPRTLR